MTIEGCATALVAAGALSAVAGVCAGNRTAYALLASAIFSTFLCETGVPFHPALWLAIDITVIMWILIGWADKVLQGGYGRKRDVAILAIFAAIWPLYFMPWIEQRSAVIDVLVAVQMFLTFPARLTAERLARWAKVSRNGGGPLEMALA